MAYNMHPKDKKLHQSIIPEIFESDFAQLTKEER